MMAPIRPAAVAEFPSGMPYAERTSVSAPLAGTRNMPWARRPCLVRPCDDLFVGVGDDENLARVAERDPLADVRPEASAWRPPYGPRA